jgi:hypothetical protein
MACRNAGSEDGGKKHFESDHPVDGQRKNIILTRMDENASGRSDLVDGKAKTDIIEPVYHPRDGSRVPFSAGSGVLP